MVLTMLLTIGLLLTMLTATPVTMFKFELLLLTWACASFDEAWSVLMTRDLDSSVLMA